MQINYKNTNVVTTYEPGQLQIKVDNLGKYMTNTKKNTSSPSTTKDYWANPMKAEAISADELKQENKQYDWSYQETEEIQSIYDSKVKYFNEYILTNNIAIEQGTNVEGTIQVSYRIDSEDVFQIERAELKAQLNNEINSDLIHFSFSSPKSPYSKAKASVQEALVSYDGLPENAQNYIWVKYKIDMGSYLENIRLVKKYLFSINIPAGGIALDYEMQKIEQNENGLYITDKTWEMGNGSMPWATYVYVGYPKENYEGQTISQSFDIYGDYCDNIAFKNSEENIECFKSFKIDGIILDDFNFSYDGQLDSLNIRSYLGKATYNLIKKGVAKPEFATIFDVKYTGKTYNLKIYNDIFGITDEVGNFSKLLDNEYRINKIDIHPIVNSNNVTYGNGKYEIDLYVRHANEEEFVKYSSWSTSASGKYITFKENENVVAYYVLYKDLREGAWVKEQGNYLRAYIDVFRSENLKEEGSIYAISAMEKYEKQENAEYIYVNNVSLENYQGNIGEDIANYDIEKYGHYMHRAKGEYKYKNNDTYNTYIDKLSVSSIKENLEKEKVEFDVNWDLNALNSDTTYIENIYGFKLYELLPLGVEFNGTEEYIKNSISKSKHYNKWEYLKINNEYVQNEEQLNNFLKEHLTLNTIQNWNNTGRTKIELIIDFRNEPIYIQEFINKNYLQSLYFQFSIPLSISYDNIEIYGVNYASRMYYQPIIQDENLFIKYGWKNSGKDDGTLDKDFIDIDEDGDIEEKFNYDVQNYVINHVISSHQDIKVLVQTDRSNYTDELAKASNGAEYTYKLRVRSGINAMTNLVIYNSIEEYAKDKEGNTVKAYGNKEHWKGNFEGIDTSYAESQGYTVKTYYSENELVEELGKDTSWKEYTETVDKTKVKSLAFEFLDSEGNKAILPGSSYIYVTIKMIAPAETDTTSGNQEAFAYNGCWSEWTAIDEKGNEIDFISGINSNIVQISLKDTFNLKVNKVWEDSTNSLGVRPDNIEIKLLQNDIEYQTATISSENNWEYTFENVPISDNTNKKYKYSVIDNVNLYELTKVETTEDEREFTLTNTLKADELYTSVNGTKIWNDDNNEKGKRPEKIKINLLRDEIVFASQEVTAENNWQYNFENVPIWKNNTEKYVYTVIEENPSEKYEAIIENLNEKNGLKIKFSNNSKTESTSYDYVYIYYNQDEKIYRYGPFGGDTIADQEVIVPTKDFYLYWHTDNSNSNYYGFSIDNIEHIKTTESANMIVTLPDYEIEELTGNIYPESEHTYQDNVNKLWHYTAEEVSNGITINITNTYKKIPATLTVHHYKEGTTEKLSEDKINNVLLWDDYETTEATDIPEEYELASVEGEPKGEITKENQEVTYYYKLKDASVLVHHYIEETTTPVPLINGENAEDIKINGKVTSEYATEALTNIPEYYELVSTPENATGTMTLEQIEVTYYYRLKSYQYIVNYLEKDTNQVLKQQKQVEDVIYGTVVDSNTEKVNIEGYDFDSFDKNSLTINVTGNTINIYYTKRNDLSYTVNYLEKDTNKVLNTAKVVNNQTYQNQITEQAIDIEGYVKQEPTEQTITIAVESNVINFYYTKRNDLSYTVNYLEKDTNKVLNTEKIVNNQTYQATVTEQAIDIEGYVKQEPTEQTITIAVENNVINFYYTKRNDLSYTVKYLESDSTLDNTDDNKVLHEERVVTNQEFNKLINSEDEVISIDGYNYAYCIPDQINLGINNDENVIAIFYTKVTGLRYEVNYLEKDTNEIIAPKYTCGDMTFGDTVTSSDEVIDIDGYNYDSADKELLTITTGNNVINIYYTKRNDLSYTVNYLEKDTNKVLNIAKIVTNQTYQATVTEQAIDIEGYVKQEPTEQTITISVENNTINFYYTKRNDLSYTVNYLEKDTENVLKVAKNVNEQTYQSIVTEQAVDIEGYVKQEPTEQTITIAIENNVINFYYTKRNDLSYKVNYLEKNTNKILHEQKTVNNIEFESVINTNDEVITIDGYNYDSADKENLTIAVKDNVINIYYTKVNGLSYKVNYLEKNTNKMLSPTKVVGNQVFENVITSSNEVIEIDGYNYDSLDKDTLTITTGENVINIYYTKRNDLSYKVNYLEKDTNKILSTQKVVNDMTFEDIINSSDEIITIDGYDYDSVDKNSLTITTGENVINIYYTKRRDLSYKVNYLEKDTNKVLNTQKVVDSVTFEDVINTEDEVIEIDGYNYDSVDKDELVIQTGENLINIYYTKRNDLSYKVNYLEKDTNKVLSTQKVVDNVTFEDVITSSDEVIEIDGYNYDSVDKAELVITTSENVINIYYTKRSDLSYKVNYLEKDTDKVLSTQKVVNNVTLEDVITSSSEVIEIDGYNYDSVDKDELVITTSENVINIYYTKRTDLSYTVNYLEKDTNKVLKDQKVVDNVTFEDVIKASDEVVDIYGYNFDSANVDELVIATKDNVINLYYTKKDATVVVHHYAEGTTTKVANDVTVTGKVGDDYETETSSEVPSKYELAQSPANATGTMTEDTVEVIYYYRLKSTKVIVHHYEEGTTNKLSEDVEIEGLIDSTYTTTSADDIPIKYALVEIPTNATGIMTEEVIEVTYYYAVKDAELNIYYLEKDTDIELAKPEKQTGKVGEMYRTDAKEIEGYTLVGNSGNTTGQLEVEPLTVIYYYLQNTRATVQYIDITTGEILDERTDEGLVGDEFVTETKTFDDYILVQEPAQKTVNMTKDEIVLKYYYLHISGGVIEQHIDVISGDVLYNGTHEGNEGDEYNIPSKDFTGYDLVEDRLPANSEGTMTVNPITVTYYYIHRAKVTTQYIDKTTGEKITPDVVETGHEDDLYTTENKVFEGYKLIQVPENSNGNMTKEDIIVKYYYVPESAGVVERHLDVLTDEPLVEERNYYGYAEDNYETEAKQIPGYDLVKERYPENATGKMTKEEIVVTYYYARRVQVQVKYVDKITGQEIADTEVIDGHKGDNYTTEEKAISGYDLIEVPTNQKGIMFDDVTEVIYYYIKPAKVITNYYDIDTKETIAAEEVIDGHEGDEYETVQKEIKYYNLVEVPENKAGNMTVEDIAVNYYYKKKDFNLKVEKQVKEIAYNGQVLSINGNIGKVELDKNKIASTEMVVTYEIKVTNTAELRGGAELIENIPNGMTMKEEDNKDWVIHEDTAILSVEDLEPGQERSYNVVMRWTPSENNLGMKENIAEIVKVDNEAGFEEITIEDNKGKADLVISIKTGAEDDNTIVKLAILAIFIVLGITVTCIILKEKNRK